MLASGTGKAATARLWTYGRDERPWGGDAPPAVFHAPRTQDRPGGGYWVKSDVARCGRGAGQGRGPDECVARRAEHIAFRATIDFTAVRTVWTAIDARPVRGVDAYAQPLAPGAAAVRARHVRRGPGLVDEHKPPGIEIGLRLEPGAALLQDIRPVLLDRMSGLFFRVRPWRWKKRDRAELEAAMPRSARRAHSSSRLWSRASSNAAMTSACRASIRRDRMSPPCGFGAKPPVARRDASQRITEDTETPNRLAEARRLIPASTAANARTLKSIANGLPISLPDICLGNTEVRNEPL